MNLEQQYDRVDANFATNLRTHREARSVSQDDLAQRMAERGFGFTQATIWKIEQGKRPVRISEAAALADALGLLSWSSLFAEPEASRHLAALQSASGRAYDAYGRIKQAAADYLHAQDEVALAAREAHDAGMKVFDGYTSWLRTPAERASLEARAERDHEGSYHERLDGIVEEMIEALRDRGWHPILDPADIEIVPAGPVPTWTPPEGPHAQERPQPPADDPTTTG